MAVVEEIFNKPFGPFLDYDVLNDPKNVRGRSRGITLTNLRFEQNHQLIGLDDVEDLESREAHPIRFRGIFRLTNRSWLSQDGRDELTLRVKQQLREHGFSVGFDECVKRFNVRLEIQGNLMAIPAFLTNKKGAEELKVHTVDRGTTRQYAVGTLDPYVYSRSRLFIERYRLLNKLQSFANPEESAIQQRTPRWLLYKYMDSLDRHGTLSRPRVHRSDVLNLFGRHCRWLAEKNSSMKIFNKKRWAEFCTDAGVKDKQWIMEVEKWERDELQDSEEEGEEVEETVAQRALRQEQERAIGYTMTYRFNTRARRPADPETRNHLAIAARIPLEIFEQPRPPPDFIWFCPVDQCQYYIHLLDLQNENLEHMHPDDREWLEEKDWKLSDKRFQMLFNDMVERHYFKHLRRWGVSLAGFSSGERRVIDRPGQLRWDDNAKIVLTENRGNRFV